MKSVTSPERGTQNGSALSGLVPLWTMFTQGVALGWRVVAPSGRQKSPLIVLRNRPTSTSRPDRRRRGSERRAPTPGPPEMGALGPHRDAVVAGRGVGGASVMDVVRCGLTSAADRNQRTEVDKVVCKTAVVGGSVGL